MGKMIYKRTDASVTYTGRSGDAKCAGLSVIPRTQESGGVMLVPVNSQGKLGSCSIDVPANSVKEVAVEMLKLVGINVDASAWPEAKKPEYYYCINIPGGSVFHKTSIRYREEDQMELLKDAVCNSALDPDDAREVTGTEQIDEEEYLRATQG